MHTFFINTTERQCFKEYRMLYHHYLANHDLIMIEQSLDTISECVDLIQELINKDPDIRDDFGILAAVDIDAGKQLFSSAAAQQAWVTWIVQEQLMKGLKDIDFKPEKFALIYIVSHAEQEEWKYDYPAELRAILPWKTFDDEKLKSLDPDAVNIIRSWGSQSFEQSRYDPESLMQWITDDILKCQDQNKFDSHHGDDALKIYLENRHEEALSDYYMLLPEEGATFILPTGNDEKRNRVLFSCAAYVRRCVEEGSYTCKDKYIDFNGDFLEVLKKHHYCLENVKNTLMDDEGKFPLYNETEQNENLLNRTVRPEFKEIRSDLPPTDWFSLISCSTKKLLEFSEKYVESVKRDIRQNSDALEKWSGELSVEFRDYQNKFNHRSEPYPDELFSSQTREKTLSAIRFVQQKMRESIVNKQIELSKQKISSYENENIDAAIREYKSCSEGEFKKLENSRIFSGIVTVFAILIAFILPYFLVSDSSGSFILRIIACCIYILIFAVVYFLSEACIMNRHKQAISQALHDFSLKGESSLKALRKMYDDLSRRFNVIIPDLIRRKLYLQWLNNEERHFIEREEKLAVHRQQIEDDLIVCKKLEENFSQDLFNGGDSSDEPDPPPDLEIDNCFDLNDRVYMLLADEKIGQYCSEVLK